MFDRYLRQILRGATVGIVLFACFVFGIDTGFFAALISPYKAEPGFFITFVAAGITFLACIIVDLSNPAALSKKREDRPTPSIVWCAAVNFAVIVFCSTFSGL